MPLYHTKHFQKGHLGQDGLKSKDSKKEKKKKNQTIKYFEND